MRGSEGDQPLAASMMACSRTSTESFSGAPEELSSSLRPGKKLRRWPCGLVIVCGSTVKRKIWVRILWAYSSSVSVCGGFVLRGGAAAGVSSSASAMVRFRGERGASDEAVPGGWVAEDIVASEVMPSLVKGLGLDDEEEGVDALVDVILIFVRGGASLDTLDCAADSVTSWFARGWPAALASPVGESAAGDDGEGCEPPSFARRRARICSQS